MLVKKQHKKNAIETHLMSDMSGVWPSQRPDLPDKTKLSLVTAMR